MLVPNKLKQVGLGQSIVQAVRPHSFIAPLLLGLALKLDAHHGSEDLLMALARVGFSVSYDEVTRYKQSLVMSQVPGESRVRGYPPVFTQWVADNVDHNSRTLDGLNTFHGMGVISVSTSPQVDVIVADRVIPRLKRRLPAAETAANRGLPISEFDSSEKSGLTNVTFLPIKDLQHSFESFVKPSVLHGDLLWHLTMFFQTEQDPCPNWMGYMHAVCTGDHSPPAVVDMLPLVPIN
jgi:hypothetical protein